jgi:hypothetical protein
LSNLWTNGQRRSTQKLAGVEGRLAGVEGHGNGIGEHGLRHEQHPRLSGAGAGAGACGKWRKRTGTAPCKRCAGAFPPAARVPSARRLRSAFSRGEGFILMGLWAGAPVGVPELFAANRLPDPMPGMTLHAGITRCIRAAAYLRLGRHGAHLTAHLTPDTRTRRAQASTENPRVRPPDTGIRILAYYNRHMKIKLLIYPCCLALAVIDFEGKPSGEMRGLALDITSSGTYAHLSI